MIPFEAVSGHNIVNNMPAQDPLYKLVTARQDTTTRDCQHVLTQSAVTKAYGIVAGWKVNICVPAGKGVPYEGF